ncbi:MAG TPA: capsular polysaccharide synthesis protein [Stenomitos sp.]
MLNKTIWLLWLQGWSKAPSLIKEVAQSWEINNPNWNIEYLTADNLHQYVSDIEYIYDESKEIGYQARADIIRLSLLKNHGGVWADATMLCMQPLDPWIEDAVGPAGLWMYHTHGGGMSCRNGPASWFIGSQKSGLIINKWKAACDEYWKNRVRADSYFWIDRRFKKLYQSDPEFKRKWDAAPYLYAELRGQPHSFAHDYKIESNNQDIKKILLEKPPFILKFWWKEWCQKFPDMNSSDYKQSNACYAIQMSKRRFIYKHEMESKKSIGFWMKTSFWDCYFVIRMFPLEVTQRFKRGVAKVVKGLTSLKRSLSHSG